MNVEVIINGYLKENCYIAYDEKNALIIDPGSEGEKIVNFIEKNKLNVKAILITHYHFDHIAALDYLKEKYNTNVIDYKSDKDIIIDNFYFRVIECFGHTLDSVIFYFYKNKIIFSGDFIFKGTIGVTEEENYSLMMNSLKIIKTFDKDVIIYPGHGESTTVLEELRNNYFLRGI